MKLVADPPDDRRGLSPVVGIVLLFGMVLMGATLVAIGGMSLIDTMQTESSLDQAETSMQQVQSDLGELSNSPDERRTGLELGNLDQGSASVVDDGEMTFDINPDEPTASSCKTTMQIGTLEYERDGSTVGFQGGGVWRSNGESPTMVSQPDLTYDETRRSGQRVRSINFPATNIDPDNSSLDGSNIEAAQNRSLSEERQAKMQEELFSCLSDDDNDRVHSIEIQISNNQYAEAWYRYLEEQIGTAGTVRWDGDDVVATAPLGPAFQPEYFTIADPDTFGSLYSGSAFDPSDLNQVTFDGYNSQVAPYDDSGSYDRATGKLVSAKDVSLNGNFDFYGDVFAGEEITIPGAGNDIDGDEHENADIDEPPNIDDEISSTISEIEENEENGNAEAIASESLDLSNGGSATLESGVYYLNSLEIPRGATLTLDTSDGDIAVAAPDGVTVANGATVEVTGGNAGQARIFSDADVDVDGNVVVNEDRSYKNFWYAPSDARMSLKGDEFVGVAYAPKTAVTIGDGLDVYGSLIGQFDGGIRKADFHYDNTLEQLSGDGTSAVIGDGEVTGPSDPELESFDARATILGSEFSNDARAGDIYPSLELESISNDDGDLDSLSYWEETGSRVSADDGSVQRDSDGGSLDERYDGDDLDRLAYGEYGESRLDYGDNYRRGVFSETVQFDGESGDEIEIVGGPEDRNIYLQLRDSNGDSVAAGWNELSHTLDGDDSYLIQVASYNRGDYRLELRETSPDPDDETFYYEDVAFDARNGDDIEIAVSSDEASSRIDLLGPSGGTIATEQGGSSVTIDEHDLSGGEHTVRVSSASPETEFDYDVSLKRTKIDYAPLLSHGPISVDLVTNPPGDSATYHEPWPAPRLDARGYSDAGWNDDVNHPAVPEVRSTTLEGLEPRTGFSVEMDYRFQLCNPTRSYAGTSKVIDGTRHFEVGCSSNAPAQNTIEYDPGNTQNQLKILRDGDKVPHVEPAGGQRGMKDMLGPRLNDDTLDLEDGEFVIAFELDQTDAEFDEAVENDDAEADYNDVVMLYEITDQHWSEGGDPVSRGPGESPLGSSEDYSYTVNIENNQIVIGDD